MERIVILIIFAIIGGSIVYGIYKANKITGDDQTTDNDTRDIKLFSMYVSALKLKYDLEITDVRAFGFCISIDGFKLYEVDCSNDFIQIHQELEERISLYEELKAHFAGLKTFGTTVRKEQANKIMKKAKNK